MEGGCHIRVTLMSRQIPRVIEEIQENAAVRIAYVPAENRTGHLQGTYSVSGTTTRSIIPHVTPRLFHSVIVLRFDIL
jgi:hypothetical protein